MEEGWSRIYSTADPVKIEILKSMLEEENIQAVVINKQDSSYLFGESEVYVSSDDALAALQIIRNAEF
ncbi:MAG: DUF2007 domain-containing protein [Bacteroidota bacterium]